MSEMHERVCMEKGLCWCGGSPKPLSRDDALRYLHRNAAPNPWASEGVSDAEFYRGNRVMPGDEDL